MAGKRLELDVPDELMAQLEFVARELGLGNPTEAAVIGIAEWVSRRKSELDDRNPEQRYFINEALDELIEKKK